MDRDDAGYNSLIIPKRCMAYEFECARDMIVSTYARTFDDDQMEKSNMLLIPTEPFKPLPNGMVSIFKQSFLNLQASKAIKTFSRVNWVKFNEKLKTKIGLLVRLERTVGWKTRDWFLDVLTTMAIMFVKSGCDVLINRAVTDKLITYSEVQLYVYLHEIYAVHEIPHYVHFSLEHVVVCCCKFCLSIILENKKLRNNWIAEGMLSLYLSEM